LNLRPGLDELVAMGRWRHKLAQGSGVCQRLGSEAGAGLEFGRSLESVRTLAEMSTGFRTEAGLALDSKVGLESDCLVH